MEPGPEQEPGTGLGALGAPATPRSGRRTRAARIAALALVALLGVGGPAALASTTPPASAASPLAAGSPFGGSDDEAADDATSTGAEPAAAPSRTDRLAGIARELRRTPLVIDPELDWMFDARTARSMERTLRDARIPIFVAVLPSVDEDESGGDLERVVQRLQREVGKDGLYVAVDQDSRMDLASVGVPLDLGISISVLSPPRDERPYEEQERDPGPSPADSIPARLREIVDTVAKAGPGEPNGVIDDVRERTSLSGEARDARRKEDASAGVFVGVFLGLLLAGVVLGVLRVVRAARAGGPGAGGAAGGRPAGASRRGGRGASGRSASGATGGRRGRRGRGRRA
ncbi:hypothetical protein [Patulibacter sp.]|uniref:hypothetical protein n=1 Tax=Patulibacter sp. TaxID=1912859 RepID=UPI00272561AC|nr:hypothetical protein [Patulibacter sp.]MDO9408271.1 hypothetical protein [Patulibacter sp.]